MLKMFVYHPCLTRLFFWSFAGYMRDQYFGLFLRETLV